MAKHNVELTTEEFHLIVDTLDTAGMFLSEAGEEDDKERDNLRDRLEMQLEIEEDLI